MCCKVSRGMNVSSKENVREGEQGKLGTRSEQSGYLYSRQSHPKDMPQHSNQRQIQKSDRGSMHDGTWGTLGVGGLEAPSYKGNNNGKGDEDYGGQTGRKIISSRFWPVRESGQRISGASRIQRFWARTVSTQRFWPGWRSQRI